MSPAPSESLALQHVKLGDVLEICDGIIFDFYMYPGLPHTYMAASLPGGLHAAYWVVV